VISVTLVVGPLIASLAFDHLGVPAPYWIGALLATLALFAASAALLPKHRSLPAKRSFTKQISSELDVPPGARGKKAQPR
jgi:MFS family permease